MNASRRRLVKGALAILVGIPGTLAFFPSAALVVALGGLGLARDVHLDVLLFLLWGLAGLVGLAAFWVWVASPLGMSRRRRITLAVCVFVGVLAVGPLSISGNPIFGPIGLLGVATGALIISWLLVPDLPSNPDRLTGMSVGERSPTVGRPNVDGAA